MATLSASTWGDPNAPKRVLLIHGITSFSQTWHRVAREFASRGCFVTAPDLLGHGTARRDGSDYTIAAFVDQLRPLLAGDHPFHIVVGHSLGGVTASVLLPLLKSTHPVHVVLVDPPLEQSPELLTHHRQRVLNNLKYPKTAEQCLEENPDWAREDAILSAASVRLCHVPAIEAIFDQNVPWSFTHRLSTPPDNVKVTLLAADPSKNPCVREQDLKEYPHVTAKTVWGASHMIPFERPEVIVETAAE